MALYLCLYAQTFWEESIFPNYYFSNERLLKWIADNEVHILENEILHVWLCLSCRVNKGSGRHFQLVWISLLLFFDIGILISSENFTM